MSWSVLLLIKIDYTFRLTNKITGPRLPRIPISRRAIANGLRVKVSIKR
jgi:hypothetical protein